MWFGFSFLQFEKHLLDILVKQISECVGCWEQCTFGLTQYVNVNISCAHKWTQTCILSVCRPVTISLRFTCNMNCFHTHEVWKMLGWCPVSFLKCSIQQETVHVLTVLTSGNILVQVRVLPAQSPHSKEGLNDERDCVVAEMFMCENGFTCNEKAVSWFVLKP